ncbi:MAG TPA: SDR family NAD(P)-dependent oxidoreductase, partial [Streptosporangiaceae bacterium]
MQIEMVTLRRIVAKLVRKGVVDQTPDAGSRLWRQSSVPVVQLAQHQPRVHKQKEITMHDKRVALVTGANQGVGLQVAKELVASGLTVLVGSRNFERGETAAKDIGPGAIALQLDVTDGASIAAAAERIRKEPGRLDLLVNNAGISKTTERSMGSPEYAASSQASNASLDEIRAVWETNVFGVLAVYQAMLPLLRESS